MKTEPNLVVGKMPIIQVPDKIIEAQRQWLKDGTITADSLRAILGDQMTPVFAFKRPGEGAEKEPHGGQ